VGSGVTTFLATNEHECMKYVTLFEQTATGFSAHVPDLPGCVAAGATLAETAELIAGAIRLHLAGLREDGETIGTTHDSRVHRGVTQRRR